MQAVTRDLQIAAFCDSVNAICKRMDALETRRATQMRQLASARAEAEQQEIRDYLDSLPDPDNPDGPAFYSPSGHLHAVSPTNSNADNEGELPKDLLRATPPSPGNYPLDDPAELDEPPQLKNRNPVAVSLNEADEYDY
jgi:hypothetical protein